MAEKEKKEALLFKKLAVKMKKAIFDYRLLGEDDRVMIGLSGGKDSLALLELLGERMKIFSPRFRLFAVHVVMNNIPYLSDIEYLRSLCENYGVPLLVKETSFYSSSDYRKSSCFLCSWNRRKTIFEAAKEHGCNKIAMGHHQDDILETLLMNMTFQGAIGTMPPLLKMAKFDITIIRPLCLIAEKELTALAALRGYRRQLKSCPYERDSHRRNMKDILHRLEEMHPQARHTLWAAMSNIHKEYLP